MLGKKDLAVGGNIEHAATALHELRLHAERLRDLGRQTDGPGLVVSANAVGDRDLHCECR